MNVEPTVTHEIAPLPRRPADAHKGQVGRIVIVGGCAGETLMAGAPALAARAAYRGGAGLVQVVVPAELRAAVVTLEPGATARALPEPDGPDSLVSIAERFAADVIAIGPGLGDSVSLTALRELLTHFTGPIVIDADGLNLLAATRRFAVPNPGRIVLTPHPGEMRRLLPHWGGGMDAGDRNGEALALARGLGGGVVVLKGHRTVVTDGGRLFINETGNPGMATAGAGDVLTGIIAALIGQKLAPLEAAILGVHLHGLAGDFAAQELGQLPLTAVDIIDALPDAFAEHGQ